MSINHVERAFKAWPILVQRAKDRKTITYKELGDSIGIHHRVIRYVLGIIQDYCLEEKIPPLTILIVNASGRPGDGFIAYDLRNFDDGLQEVYNFEWQKLGNPFGFSQSGLSYPTIINALVENPDSSEELYAKIKSRGIMQILFRQALLKVYANKCAFTGMSFTQGLEAAHIIPWKDANNAQRLDVRNGILLNSYHHKLFDNGIMTISTDYCIKFINQKNNANEYSELDHLMTTRLHNKSMRLPHKIEHRPLPLYIDAHNLLHKL